MLYVLCIIITPQVLIAGDMTQVMDFYTNNKLVIEGVGGVGWGLRGSLG